ncbi:uncharacterized protein BDZ99DRAFT_197355 [Mytilinidion resinicola]|uniref:Dipeptidase n=1 Tax=Mytilinidion resinicola TaxID=574789 RepID=A0A6A6Z435_9PEZI|nr:uncharacterized protein BDZ99DRAFT_197355 [Mytilinidion resinicola]KAF2815499.1 hypothetical protein BDZ99DRAFT_197355 [Mytilinidion resinicola]
MEEALDIMANVPLIDGHNDFPHLVRAYYDSRLDDRFEPGKELAGHVDIKRLVEGRGGGVFWSAYIDCPKLDDFTDAAHFEPLRDTLQQIDLIHRLIDLYSNKLALASRADDLLRIFKEGKVASMIGVEGLHQIGNSASVLRMYHKLGVRYVTLAHNKNNMYADSAVAKRPAHSGLSEEGKAMVKEMNRIGMMIDLSHVSDATMMAALDHSRAPVAFTHSSCYSLVNHARNVPDNVLDRLKENNGIIMISLIPPFTHKDGAAANVDHVVDHIVHVAERIGFDHIGLGSDFDGMTKAVNGVEDVSKWPNLVAKMLSRGIARENVEKVLGLNVVRVLNDIESVSRSSKDWPVLEDKVEQLWDEDFRAFVRKAYPNAERDQR